jgi:hypothetical protein
MAVVGRIPHGAFMTASEEVRRRSRSGSGTLCPECLGERHRPVIVPGGLAANEVAFIHRSTSTLVLTDLIQLFDPEKVSPLVRPLVHLAGAMAPDAQAPVHLRFAINRNREAAQQLP